MNSSSSQAFRSLLSFPWLHKTPNVVIKIEPIADVDEQPPIDDSRHSQLLEKCRQTQAIHYLERRTFL